jgi:hypothetical protein
VHVSGNVQDEGLSERKSRLRDDLIHELVSTPGLRPTVSRKIVDRFELKRKRQSKGYSPVFLATVQGTVEPEGVSTVCTTAWSR